MVIGAPQRLLNAPVRAVPTLVMSEAATPKDWAERATWVMKYPI